MFKFEGNCVKDYTKFNMLLCRYLVSQGCILPICDLLTCGNFEFLAAGLERLESILKVGEELQELESTTGRCNAYAKCIDDVGGLQKLEGLQLHQNPIISQKAIKLLETYWLEKVDSNSQIPFATQSDNSVMKALDQVTSLFEKNKNKNRKVPPTPPPPKKSQILVPY